MLPTVNEESRLKKKIEKNVYFDNFLKDIYSFLWISIKKLINSWFYEILPQTITFISCIAANTFIQKYCKQTLFKP